MSESPHSSMSSATTDSSNNTTSIQKLFDYNRIDNQLSLVPIILYSPIGICLFLIRVFIGLHAILIASLLPKKSTIRCFILRSMCAVLGIVVKEENSSIKTKSNTKVIISNHITNFDHLAVDLVLPCIVPGVWDLPKFLNWALGFHDFGVKQGRDVLIDNVRTHLDSDENAIPILSYPEGATTNGRVGLLKFSSWLFTLDLQMQPIFITALRPNPIKVSISILGSRWWSDLFWFLFVPFTIFHIKYLPTVKRNENESPEEFAKRVQRLMAKAVSLYATNYTDSDKVELAKRLYQIEAPIKRENRVRPNNVTPSTSTSAPVSRVSPQLLEMALKAKDILPQVPISVIQRDLKVTANIDETITRILEGTVTYVPEAPVLRTLPNKSQVRANETVNNSQSNNDSTKPLYYTGSSTFGKNASERSTSYKERKATLIETARNSYLQKHEIVNNEAIK